MKAATFTIALFVLIVSMGLAIYLDGGSGK
mgnify:CR=1 FL=1